MARIRTPGQPRRSVCATVAHASTRCSQLSRTSRTSRSRRCSTTSSMYGSACHSRMPNTSATAWMTRAGSLTAASSTSHTPSRYAPISDEAASIASRVLPVPPGPVRVRARAPCRSRSIWRTSRSRPTKLLSWTGRLCARGGVRRRSRRSPDGGASGAAASSAVATGAEAVGGGCAEPAFQDVPVEQAARVGRLHVQLPSEDRPQPLELAEGQLAAIVQRVHPHQGAMGRFVGRLELEELAERVGRGVVPAGTLLDLRDPREQRPGGPGRGSRGTRRPSRHIGHRAVARRDRARVRRGDRSRSSTP